jgi:protein involved in polysaccharide export with SLBB domain
MQQLHAVSSQDSVLESDSKKICVIGGVVKPSPVWFKRPITLVQAIKEAGGVSSSPKNYRVRILRKLGGTERRVIDMDMKAIEKGNAKDVTLEGNDIVVVMPKSKKEQAPVNQVACEPCGCRIVPGIHGFSIVH